MIRHHRSKIIALLIILVFSLAAAGFITKPLPSFLISGMTVTHPASGTSESHSLNTEEAAALFRALNGTAVGTPSAENLTLFECILHMKGFGSQRFTLLASPDGDLYVRRGKGRFLRSESPGFVYAHPAFDPLYPYASPPNPRISGPDETLPLQTASGSWKYQRWNGHWTSVNAAFLSRQQQQQEKNADSGTALLLNDSETPLHFAVDPWPDTLSLQVTDPEGRLRYDQDLEDSRLPVFPYNGFHEYRLRMEWLDESKPYQGTLETVFTLEMDLPPVFELPGPKAVQGELLVFRARHLPPGADLVLHQSIAPEITLYPLEDGVVAYLPTHYGTSPGEYILQYGLVNEALQEHVFTLLPRDFHIQYLTVDRTVEATTRNEEAYAQSAKYFAPSRDRSSPERYYTEPFLLPVNGRLTTEFGETRYVNNAPTSYRHSGLDIAAPTGTPIVAVNRGNVVLSMNLILQGNTLVIDHGQGLFSVYFHLDERKVNEGELVERGQFIGTVGSTGFSTGPHLHLTMSYYRHNLEPGHFLVGEPLTYENAKHHLAPPNP